MVVKKKSLTKKKVAAKRKTVSKVTRKKMVTSQKQNQLNLASNKKAFGGYAISFAGRKETIEQVFGKKPIAPSEMTKKIWTFVKENSLSNR